LNTWLTQLASPTHLWAGLLPRSSSPSFSPPSSAPMKMNPERQPKKLSTGKVIFILCFSLLISPLIIGAFVARLR